MVVNDGDLPWLKVKSNKNNLIQSKRKSKHQINQGTKKSNPFKQKHTTIIQTNPSIIIETPRIAPVLPGGAKRTNKAGKAGETKAEPNLFDGIPPSMDPDSNGGGRGKREKSIHVEQTKKCGKKWSCVFFWGELVVIIIIRWFWTMLMILDNESLPPWRKAKIFEQHDVATPFFSKSSPCSTGALGMLILTLSLIVTAYISARSLKNKHYCCSTCVFFNKHIKKTKLNKVLPDLMAHHKTSFPLTTNEAHENDMSPTSSTNGSWWLNVS